MFTNASEAIVVTVLGITISVTVGKQKCNVVKFLSYIAPSDIVKYSFPGSTLIDFNPLQSWKAFENI